MNSKVLQYCTIGLSGFLAVLQANGGAYTAPQVVLTVVLACAYSAWLVRYDTKKAEQKPFDWTEFAVIGCMVIGAIILMIEQYILGKIIWNAFLATAYASLFINLLGRRQKKPSDDANRLQDQNQAAEPAPSSSTTQPGEPSKERVGNVQILVHGEPTAEQLRLRDQFLHEFAEPRKAIVIVRLDAESQPARLSVELLDWSAMEGIPCDYHGLTVIFGFHVPEGTILQ